MTEIIEEDDSYRDEDPPRLDKKMEKRLLKRLERAAKLARRRKISDLHQAAIGVDTVMRLYGDAGRGSEYSIRGKRFSTFDIAGRGWATLMGRTDLLHEEAIDKYGDFTGYIATLRDHQGRMRELDWAEVEWDEEMERILAEAELRLNGFNRLKFRIERWLEDQEEFFPHLARLSRTAAVAFGSAIIAAMLTAYC